MDGKLLKVRTDQALTAVILGVVLIVTNGIGVGDQGLEVIN